MALWFDLRANFQDVGRFVAQRIDGTTDPDSVGTYKVTIDGRAVQVQHRYGDGAWELVRKALDAVAQ